MRVAVTTNILLTPPNYFVTEHAQRLRSQHEFCVFALLADVRDPSIEVPVRDFAALPRAPLRLRRWAAPFADGALRAAVIEFAPDVIHQHFATWSSPAIAASRASRAPLIVTVHGYDIRSLFTRSMHPLTLVHRREVRAAARAASRVLSVSRYLADEAIAGGFDASRLEVHYQGVDTEYFTPGDGSTTSDVPIVSFVGALEPHKGVLDLVEASCALSDVYEHRLVLAGAGSLDERLRAISRENPHIEVMGRVSREGVRGLLRSSRVLVLPSRPLAGGAEAAGLVLLEAQACGTPVIAYDVGGTAEMMRAGDTGLLVPDGDRASLGAAIREILLIDDSERALLSRRAREFVVTSRSVENSSAELVRHYGDVIS